MDALHLKWVDIAALPAASAALMFMLAWMSWRNRRLAVARTACLYSLGVAWWAFGYTFELCSGDYVTAIFWFNAQYLGVIALPPAVFVLSNQLAGRMLRRSVWRVLAVSTVPVILIGTVVTDAKYHLFWRQLTYAIGQRHAVVSSEPGPAHQAHVVWTVLLMAATVGVLIHTAVTGGGVLKKQAWWLIGGLAVALTGHFAQPFGFNVWRHFDPTPTLFSLCSAVAGFVVLRSAFLRLSPVARERVFLSLPDPVFVLDLHGNLADLNLAASVLFLSAREGIGLSLREAVGGDNGSILLESDEGVFADRSFEIRRSPLTDAAAQKLGSMIYMVDITEHRRTAEVLQEAKATAEAANEAKSRFLANMSHELRTPINGVLGLAELLVDTTLDDSQSQYVRSIASCSQSLLDLVNDVLDLARLQEGKMPITPAMTDLDHLVGGIRETYAILADRKGLQFRCEIPAKLGSAIVDGARLRQILHNLLGNALKFTESGWVSLRVQRGHADEYVFIVQDTGIGIARDRQASVFQRFEQADDSSVRRFGGSGLGLAITKQLIDAMNGRLHLESEAGHGTTVTVVLRLAGSVAEAAAKAVVEQPLTRMRVLVVEDNPVNAIVAVRGLEALGCHVDLRANGQEAVDACRRQAYDLVLLDVHMPVMDGLQACGIIRKIPNQEARIVGLSAGAFPEERQRALDAGMDEYLCKPVRRSDLQELLLRVANSSKIRA